MSLNPPNTNSDRLHQWTPGTLGLNFRAAEDLHLRAHTQKLHSSSEMQVQRVQSGMSREFSDSLKPAQAKAAQTDVVHFC